MCRISSSKGAGSTENISQAVRLRWCRGPSECGLILLKGTRVHHVHKLPATRVELPELSASSLSSRCSTWPRTLVSLPRMPSIGQNWGKGDGSVGRHQLPSQQQADNPSFILGTHVMEGRERTSSSCPLTSPCVPWHARTHIQTHVNTK